jgi:RNA polymerase sigma-70 factor, ECF subfamily
MVNDSSDDQELLRRMAQGDEAAFGALYSRYRKRIFHFAWHMSGNDAMAEEITQEVFMHLIQNPRRYDPARGPLPAYMYGVARNLVRNALRQNPLELSITEEMLEVHEDDFTDRFDILASLTRTALLERLRKYILALPEQYREVLVLCDLEQMGHLEAAELLECSIGTVASRLHRARTLLRIRLREIGYAK